MLHLSDVGLQLLLRSRVYLTIRTRPLRHMAPLLPPPPIGALVLPEINVMSAETSRQLEKRFSFLWSSAHRLLPTSAALANHLMSVS